MPLRPWGEQETRNGRRPGVLAGRSHRSVGRPVLFNVMAGGHEVSVLIRRDQATQLRLCIANVRGSHVIDFVAPGPGGG